MNLYFEYNTVFSIIGLLFTKKASIYLSMLYIPIEFRKKIFPGSDYIAILKIEIIFSKLEKCLTFFV